MQGLTQGSVSSNYPCIFLESVSWYLMNFYTSISPFHSLNLLSPINPPSLSLSLSLSVSLGRYFSFVNDVGGQGAPEELSTGIYEPSREAVTPGERSESWRTTVLTVWLGFEYGQCGLYSHKDWWEVVREQKGYTYTNILPEHAHKNST